MNSPNSGATGKITYKHGSMKDKLIKELGLLDFGSNSKKTTEYTEPSISDDIYAKWLTDRYISDTNRCRRVIRRHEAKIKELQKNMELLRGAISVLRAERKEENKEFRREFYNNQNTESLQKNISNLMHRLENLRKANEALIIENLKLKKQIK